MKLNEIYLYCKQYEQTDLTSSLKGNKTKGPPKAAKAWFLIFMHCHMLSSNPTAVHVSSTHCRSTNHRAEKVNHILPERSRRDSFRKVWFLSSAHSIGWTMGWGRQTESRVLSVPGCLLLHRLILNDILSLIQ